MPAPEGVKPEVQAQVDTVLAPTATSEQRQQAYQAVQEYVDDVGGVGDAGIVEQAIPEKAAEILQQQGIPTIVDPEVVAAVDGQLAADATPGQRREAYAVAQAEIDRIGGVGDSGVTEEYLPIHVGQILRDAGLPAKYDQEVVNAVDVQLPFGTSPADLEQAYAAVQDYVDQVGGVGDAGITAEYLPERAAQVMSEHGIELGDTPFDPDTWNQLSFDQQKIVRELFNSQNTDSVLTTDERSMIENLGKLVGSDGFAGLDADERTAVLAQAKNYPDARSVSELGRLVEKEWFQDMGLEDTQRAAKIIAYMGQYDEGDRDIIQNTLDRFLDPNSDYTMDFDEDDAYGSAGDDGDFHINPEYIDSGNDPLDVSDDDTAHVVQHTMAHEVSHLVNGDETDQTFDYLNQEYRAWYVGYQAEHGHPPSNEDALGRWEFFLDKDGGYSDYSHGITRPFWFDTDGALDKPEEAEKIFEMLSSLTGLDVNEDNYEEVLASDPSTWNTEPGDPAATDWPDGTDLDN